MSTRISFSHVEKKILHQFRNQLNLSEDINDVINNFSNTVSIFLNEIFENRVKFQPADIQFTPNNGSSKYKFDNKVLDKYEFKMIMKNSDLENILDRFADAAEHRCIHLKKHMEKTNSKINGPNKTH